jgi:hypothetical protein
MINDEPDARGLVSIALRTFRDSVLPVVPTERRFEALMIANALGIAERELTAKPDAALKAQIPQLCRDIDAGAYDTPERQADLRNLLWELTRARLAISNPRLLDPVPPGAA